MSIATISDKLSINKVNLYTASKHNILPEFQIDDIGQVARNLVGLHSARLPTPFVTLHSRLHNFQTQDLQDELFVSRNLIKVRCMRKTLHIVPLDLAPVVHQATLHFRVADCLRVYKKYNLSDDDIQELQTRICELVRQKPLSSQAILSVIAVDSKHLLRIKDNLVDWKHVIRTVIKHLWEQGVICYLNTSRHWGSESRLYGYTKNWYPRLDFQAMPSSIAQTHLIKFHIEKYGPVTENDICWWSGLGKKTVREGLIKIADELLEVYVGGFKSPFYMSQLDYARYLAFKSDSLNRLALLAYEDPSLKGYFESRKRYIRPQYYAQLFNQIGEARASIMINGEVGGVWCWDKQHQRIHYELFWQFDSRVLRSLNLAIQELESCLNELNQQPVVAWV